MIYTQLKMSKTRVLIVGLTDFQNLPLREAIEYVVASPSISTSHLATIHAIVFFGRQPWRQQQFITALFLLKQRSPLPIYWNPSVECTLPTKIPANEFAFRMTWEGFVANREYYKGQWTAAAAHQCRDANQEQLRSGWLKLLNIWQNTLKLHERARCEFDRAHEAWFSFLPRFDVKALGSEGVGPETGPKTDSKPEKEKENQENQEKGNQKKGKEKRENAHLSWLSAMQTYLQTRSSPAPQHWKEYLKGAILISPTLVHTILYNNMETVLELDLHWCLQHVFSWAQRHPEEIATRQDEKANDPFRMFVIGLERRKDKNWPTQHAQLKQFPSILQPEFFPASDGRQLCKKPAVLIPTNLPYLSAQQPKGPLNFGSIGCFLSHLRIWSLPQTFGWCIAAEDDNTCVGMTQPTMASLQWVLREFLSPTCTTRLSKIDTIWVGFHTPRAERWKLMSHTAPRVLLSMNDPNHMHTIGGTFAYLVSDAGRQRWKQRFESQKKIMLGVDTWMMHQDKERQLVLDVPVFFSEFHNGTTFESDCSY